MAVDMETSAIFALARYRKVEAASALIISDLLMETGWQQAWEHEFFRENTELLLECVLKTLSKS